MTVDDGVGNDTTFLVTWQTGGPPEMVLRDPNGRKYHTDDFVTSLALQTARLWIPGTAQVGAVRLFMMTVFRQVITSKGVTATYARVRRPYSDVSRFYFKFLWAFCECSTFKRNNQGRPQT